MIQSKNYFYFLFVIQIIFTFEVHAQSHLDYLGQLQYEFRSSSLTRYVDDDGTEYALIGIYDATSIVDISDPTNPVEVFSVPGPAGIWREMKTYNHHAYITNETEGGLQILDLTNLPFSVESYFLQYLEFDTLETAHTIFIDENGFCYLFGSNLDNGGATILDLNINPINPPKIGAYPDSYIHDGFVRNDTLWAAHIYTGKIGIIDMSDKANPILIGEQSTPFAFAHNCWVSDNGKYLFITDEKPGAFITAYDVTNLSDIKEVGRYQSHPGLDVIPHNTYFLNNYLINAYYRDGVIILDATKPDNMIKIASYDTSPFEPAGIFNGCWGVDPYLPSGNIIASDIEEGLFILSPDYHRASYLEGIITDEINGGVVIDAKVEIMGTEDFDATDFIGEYKTGTSESGLYDVRISKTGCYTKIYPDVELIEAEITELDASIACTLVVNNTDILQKDLLLECFPNVFKNETTIHFQTISQNEKSTIRILNQFGMEVFKQEFQKQNESVTFGKNIPSGNYFIQLSTTSGLQKTIHCIKL